MKAVARSAIALSISVALLAACGQKSTDDLLASARTYLAAHDGKAAIIQLKNALQREPGSAPARFLLGSALLETGDAASAAVELRRALDLQHPAVEAVPVLARAMLAERAYQKLVDEFDRAAWPDAVATADLRTSLASAHRLLGHADQAEAALRQALDAVPTFPPALIVQAQLAADGRRFDDALALIGKVVQAAPNNAEAWHQQGEFLLFGKGEMESAASAYRKALALKPDHVSSRSSLIALLLAQRDLKAAAEQVDVLRKTRPKSPQTQYFEAQLAFAGNDLKKANELVQQLLKVAPDSVMVLQLAGAVALGNGALIEAERLLNKALSLAPDLPVARRRLAQTFLRLQQPTKALTALAPLLAQADPEAQTYALAATAYLQAGDLGRAEAHFAKASQRDPNDTRSRTGLVLSRVESGGADVAVTELQEIASADKGTYADLALVSLSIRNKDFDRALKAIDALESKSPDKPLAAQLRGRVQLLRKDVVDARRSFERALTIDPVYVPAVVSLASLDIADKQPAAAKQRFEAVLKIDPKNLQALLGIVELRGREGAPREEIAGLMSNAAKLNPTEPTPRLLLINYQLQQREFKAALAAAQDASAAFPLSPDVLDALGRAQLAAGDTNQAITSFNKLATLDPTSPKVYMRLADAQRAAKDPAAAERSLRRALAVQPDYLPAQQALIDVALGAGRAPDALKVARDVQRQRPGEAVGWLLEGSIDVARNDLAAAVAVYRNAFKQFPASQPAIKLHSILVKTQQDAEAERHATAWLSKNPDDADFMSHLGEIEIGRQNYAAAERYYRSVAAMRPDQPAALNNIAWAMYKLGKKGAVPFAEKADRLRPNTPALMNTLAAVLAAENELGRAIAIQSKVVALVPMNAQFRLELAKLMVQAGDKAAARAELEIIAKQGDQFADQGEVSRLLQRL